MDSRIKLGLASSVSSGFLRAEPVLIVSSLVMKVLYLALAYFQLITLALSRSISGLSSHLFLFWVLLASDLRGSCAANQASPIYAGVSSRHLNLEQMHVRLQSPVFLVAVST